VLGLGGCATPPPPSNAPPADIYLDGQGTAMLFDEQAPVAELPRLLARAHVPRQRTLAVHVMDTRDKSTMAQITTLLAQAGYRRITFIGVRHADATVH